MHELSVTENILEIALRHAQKSQARRITSLNLVIGQLSSILDDSVQFYWGIIAQNTIAAEARLHFERLPARFHCRNCQEDYQLIAEQLGCPKCGSPLVSLTQGEEFYLESIEIE